jgi:hypothetical protein
MHQSWTMCKVLLSLPESVGRTLTGLTSLPDLRACIALKTLPESVAPGALVNGADEPEPGRVRFACETLWSVPESVGASTGLESLGLRSYWALRSLPESIDKDADAAHKTRYAGYCDARVGACPSPSGR